MLQEWLKKFAKACCWTTMKLLWMQSAKELTTNSLKPLFNHTEWVLHTWVIFSMTFVDSYWRPVGIAPTQVFSLLHKLCYGSPTSNSSLNHSLKVTQWNFIMHVSKQTYEISTRNIECIKYSNECVFLGFRTKLALSCKREWGDGGVMKPCGCGAFWGSQGVKSTGNGEISAQVFIKYLVLMP